MPSRLVPVAASPRRDPLLARYGDDRHIVLPAIIGIGWVGSEAGGPLVYGHLRALSPADLAVPHAVLPVLAALQPEVPRPRVLPRPDAPELAPPPAPPRYEVEIAIGRFGWPWIRGIRRLAAGSTTPPGA